ncbi:MAG: hypothetical protein AB1638_07875 [Nitrospirota bacterium]
MKVILGEQYLAGQYKDMIVFVDMLSICLVLSPFYLYAPIYIILKNCFVYEAIREGFRFLLKHPVKHSMPVLIIAVSGIIKSTLMIEGIYYRFVSQLVFWISFFVSIIIAKNIFQVCNVSYVSLKDKIESKMLGRSDRKLFQIYRGKIE